MESETSDSSEKFNEKETQIQNFTNEQRVNKSMRAFFDYKKVCDEIEPLFNDFSFSALGYFRGKKIIESLPEILQQLDFSTLNLLVTSPPEIIIDFVKFIRENFPEKENDTMAQIWPPRFAINSPRNKALLLLLIRLVQLSNNPDKTIAWICTCIYKNDWSQQNEQPLVYGVSLLKTQKDSMYMILDKDKAIHVFAEKTEKKKKKKKGLSQAGTIFKSVFCETAVRVVQSEKNPSQLTFTGITGRIIANLKLVNEQHAQYWLDTFAGKPPHFFYFLSEIKTIVPSLIYQGIYSAVTRADMLSVHVLLKPGISNSKATRYNILFSLFDIFNYAQKTILLVKTILAMIFEDPQCSFDNLIGKNELFENLSTLVCGKCGQSYLTGFCSRLYKYIVEDPYLDSFAKAKRLEVVFFTCLKYILDSYDEIPNTIKQVCSMVACYSNIRFNNINYTIRIVLHFFSNMICNYLDCEYEKTKIKSLMEVSKMLRYSFKFQHLPPKYDIGNWNTRLEKHFRPKASQFAMLLIHSLCEATYPIPPVNLLIESIEIILNHVVRKNKEIVDSLNSIANGIEFTSTCFGWTLASCVSLYFKENISDEIKPPSFPQMLSLSPLFIPGPQGRAYAALVDCAGFTRRRIGTNTVNNQNEDKSEEEEETELTDSVGPIIPRNVVIQKSSSLLNNDIIVSESSSSQSSSDNEEEEGEEEASEIDLLGMNQIIKDMKLDENENKKKRKHRNKLKNMIFPVSSDSESEHSPKVINEEEKQEEKPTIESDQNIETNVTNEEEHKKDNSANINPNSYTKNNKEDSSESSETISDKPKQPGNDNISHKVIVNIPDPEIKDNEDDKSESSETKKPEQLENENKLHNGDNHININPNSETKDTEDDKSESSDTISEKPKQQENDNKPHKVIVNIPASFQFKVIRESSQEKLSEKKDVTSHPIFEKENISEKPKTSKPESQNEEPHSYIINPEENEVKPEEQYKSEKKSNTKESDEDSESISSLSSESDKKKQKNKENKKDKTQPSKNDEKKEPKKEKKDSDDSDLSSTSDFSSVSDNDDESSISDVSDSSSSDTK